MKSQASWIFEWRFLIAIAMVLLTVNRQCSLYELPTMAMALDVEQWVTLVKQHGETRGRCETSISPDLACISY